MLGLKVFFNSYFKVAFSRSQVLEISGEILKISIDLPYISLNFFQFLELPTTSNRQPPF